MTRKKETYYIYVCELVSHNS